MAGYLNKVILIGNLGVDPEVKTLQSGTQVANISLATTETWKDKTTGEKKSETQWHRLEAWGKTAGVVEKYLKKGDSIAVVGSIKYNHSEKDDGTKTYWTKIKVVELTMLGSGSGSPAHSGSGTQAQEVQVESEVDDLPF